MSYSVDRQNNKSNRVVVSSSSIQSQQGMRIRKSPLSSIMQWICHSTAYVLFLLMLLVPTQLQIVKLSLTLFLLAVIVFQLVRRGRLQLHPVVVRWSVVMVLIGFGFTLLGWYRNNPGAIANTTVYILWPMVFTLFIAGIGKNTQLLEGLLRVMLFSSVVGSLLILGVFQIDEFGLIGGWLQNISPGFNFVRFQFYPINTLVFLLPFIITVVLFWNKEWRHIGQRSWFLGAIVLGLAAVISADRRSLTAVTFMSPFIAAFVVFGLVKPNLSRLMQFAISIGMLSFFGIIILYWLFFFWYQLSPSELTQRILLILDFGSTEHQYSNLIRQQQTESLLVGWFQKPLFGTGFGATIPGSLRSIDMPWASELSYLVLLYNTGLIGFSLYALSVLWVIRQCIQIARLKKYPHQLITPVLIGMLAFLIANASNPYLTKYDYMWVIFLPISFINYSLLTRDLPA